MADLFWALILVAAGWYARKWYEARKERRFLEEHLGPYAGLTWFPKGEKPPRPKYQSAADRKMDRLRKSLGY